MTAKLHIAPDLTLPIEAVTETFAILAKRGVGKTSTAVVLVEEMVGAGQQVVVIDPVGVWWGLRSSADGKGPGLTVVILGGKHADVPLDPSSGELVADLIYDGGFPAVLDLGQWTKGQQSRFVAAFAERIYARCERPLHIVLDEADAFVPQKVEPDQARMVGAIDVLVRRGRARGLGCTLITQRSAVVNKNVLTQIETLFALRTIAPQDIKVLEDWLKYHESDKKRDELLSTIASLPKGTAWVWSPGWLEVFKKVAVRWRRTFDSSATPKVGETPVVPKVIAPVDVEAVRAKLAVTIEKAEQEDPARLRRRINDLERELEASKEREQAVRDAPPVVAAAPERIEIPAITADDRAGFDVIIERLMSFREGITDEINSAVSAITGALDKVTGLPYAGLPDDTTYCRVCGLHARLCQGHDPADVAVLATPAPVPRRATAPPAATSSNGDLTGPQRKILTALAELRALRLYPADKVQVGIMAGYTNVRSGGFSEPFAALVSGGYVVSNGGLVEITDVGARAIPAVSPPRTPREMQDRVCSVLTGPEQKLLRAMLASPKPNTKETIGDACGYTNVRSGGFSEPFARLVALGLVEQPQRGLFAPAPVLFLRNGRS